MKYIKYILLLFIISFYACDKSFLDKAPTNRMTADNVYNDPQAVVAYFASMYSALPIEDFNYCNGKFSGFFAGNSVFVFPGDGSQFQSNWTYESGYNSSLYNGDNHGDSWAQLYKSIRVVNAFITEIPDVTSISATQKRQYIAEGKFIRAYYYSELAKIFGGVPIIKAPQFNLDSARLPRDKEVDVWDFVKADLDSAVAGLPATSTYGRANKYVALALESRVMLYAGSIAKYGVPAANGLTGMDASLADKYFQASYDASLKIKLIGGYSLFTKYASTDRAKNFQMLFIETQGNPEAIFCKGFDYDIAKNKTHSNDFLVLPRVLATTYGNRQMVSLTMAEMFQHVDGSPGTLNTGTFPNYVHYKDLNVLFANMDPRFSGTVITPGSTFKGVVITAQRGIYDSTRAGNTEDLKCLNGSDINQLYDPITKKVGATGTLPGTGNSSNSRTGMWIKKYTDPTRDKNLCLDWRCETDYIDLRYGEVLLNLAEAAYELNLPGSDALDAINELHTRAGIATYATIDRDKIRHERAVELAFENKVFWDFKRWRTLHTYFNNFQMKGLAPFFDINRMDYIVRRMDVGGPKSYLDPKFYYEPIPSSERNNNPLLINNPGY